MFDLATRAIYSTPITALYVLICVNTFVYEWLDFCYIHGTGYMFILWYGLRTGTQEMVKRHPPLLVRYNRQPAVLTFISDTCGDIT